MADNVNRSQCEWKLDLDMNKICVDIRTGKEIKRLPPSVTSMGVVIQPMTTYRAVLIEDFKDIFENTYEKGTEIKVNEMLNGDFFMTFDGELISTKGKFSQFSVIVEYEKIDSVTLYLLLENAVESEDYKEAAKIKKELSERSPS